MTREIKPVAYENKKTGKVIVEIRRCDDTRARRGYRIVVDSAPKAGAR